MLLPRRGVALVLLLGLLAALPGPAAGQPASPSAVPSGAGVTPEDGGTSISDLPRALGPEGRLPLEGTTWRLVAYRRGSGERQPGPAVAAWLTLRDGRVTGSAGCTPLRGRYGRMGDAVTLRLQGAPRPTCARPIALVERALRAGLRRAASATVSDMSGRVELVVRDVDDAVLLRFVPDDVGTLESGEWRLVRYTLAGASVAADATQPAVLGFRARQRSAAERRSSGQLIGSSGCNGIVGRYARAGSVLNVTRLQLADAPCAPGMVAQEAAIRSILESDALRVELPADGLVLSDAESGDRLEYASATPLQGTTWQWRDTGRQPAGAGPVTLRLEEGGLVSGEGPCGAYSGTYATDGRFLTLGDLAGPAECPAAGRQRRLFAGLAATVLVERVGDGFRSLDARGRVVARFSPAAAGP